MQFKKLMVLFIQDSSKTYNVENAHIDKIKSCTQE